MRIIKEIVHPQMKISIFNWNGKYLLKFEQDHLEQTFKVEEMELTTDKDLETLLNDTFINEVANRFREMSQSFDQNLSLI